MASKIKKVLSAIIVAAIMFAFVTAVPTVAETSVTVTTFAELQAQVAAFSTATGNMTILIGADIELTSSLYINMIGFTKHNHSLTIKSAPGPTRVLKRSDTGTNGFFIISDGNVFFENIIIDGNKQNPPSGGSSLPITVSGSDTTVTMNDGAIVQNVIGSHQSVIQISSYATFVLNGGKIINNDSRAVAVITNQFSFDATFIMNDGEISGNTNGNPETYGTIQHSSGVYSSGTFIMNGGKIINNNTFDNGTSTNEGSGVVIWSGRFEMYGGEISGNTITYDKSNFRKSCAGLHILTYAEEVIIGGTAKIINNVGYNGAASNVFVNENKYIKIGTGENAPKAGMEVGVTKALNNFGIMYNNGVFVQSGATGSDVQWFFSDVPTLRVTHDNGQLKLVEIVPCDNHEPPAGFVAPKCHENAKNYNCHVCGTPVTVNPPDHVFGRWVEILPENEKYPAVKIEMCNNTECDADSGIYQGRQEKNASFNGECEECGHHNPTRVCGEDGYLCYLVFCKHCNKLPLVVSNTFAPGGLIVTFDLGDNPTVIDKSNNNIPVEDMRNLILHIDETPPVNAENFFSSLQSYMNESN